jgi:hypothetical protein
MPALEANLPSFPRLTKWSCQAVTDPLASTPPERKW